MELYGLAAGGGKSSRMGTDKGLLSYYGQPQLFYLYNLLQQVCNRTFISCTDEQAAHLPVCYNFITDTKEYTGTGPMAALLSAFENQPGKNFLLVGCDYPFIQKNELSALLNGITDDSKATAFFNEEQNIYEPLIGFYPAAVHPAIKKLFNEGNRSLQYFLRTSDAGRFYPGDIRCMQSVDTPEAFEAAHKLLQQTGVS